VISVCVNAPEWFVPPGPPFLLAVLDAADFRRTAILVLIEMWVVQSSDVV
jgi:hypothetical protein